MCLLEEVLQHDARRTVCRAGVLASGLWAAPDGSVPSWLALEWMAQCTAVHGSLAARNPTDNSNERGEAGLVLLAGARRLSFRVPRFAAREEFEIEVTLVRSASQLAAFSCSVRHRGGEAVVAEGMLTTARAV